MIKAINALAYKLSANQTCTLYYLGFPKAWKIALLDIARKNNSNFKDEYGLPTNTLKKLVDSWMENVISLAPLKNDSHDECWLTSCYPYSENDIAVLSQLIKLWVNTTYVTVSHTSPEAKKLANNFCTNIKPEELVKLKTQAEICLTLKDGTVCKEAYQAIPLIAINRLLGNEIILKGQTLHLCYAAKNQLVSHPIADNKSQHQYSFVFDFSVQTTPPEQKALLLCQMSIRRWIPDRRSKEHIPYLAESINAHIKISDDKYCQVPIAYDHNAKQPDWKEQDKKCYDIWDYAPLPPADDVLKNPSMYAERVLLPFRYGMNRFVTSEIGTGVSVVDKASLHGSVATLLGDMICENPKAARVSLSMQHFSTYSSPQDYNSPEEFRSWVSKCTGTNHIIFELYGLLEDSCQQAWLKQVQEKIGRDFGAQTNTSCLKVECVCKDVDNLCSNMQDSKKQTQIKRRDEIVNQLGPADTVTACILLLPGQDCYTTGDPKQVIRNAFARTGRVVQFIIPEKEINQHKLQNSVYDLYRQLGVVALINLHKNAPSLSTTPCVGMHLCTQIHGISNNARFLPIFITVDLLEGKTQVHCAAFSNQTVSYREACLEMAQLFWKKDLEQRCTDASNAPANKLLTALKIRYPKKDNSVLVVVQSDANMRAVWGGISDKKISDYNMKEKYCPAQIDAGTYKSPLPISLTDTGVRIIRIRSNMEVPDYFTDLSEKATANNSMYSSAAGIFKYEDVYWGINARPNDQQYKHSFIESKIDHPNHRFAEKDMIELYPLQLQTDDNAESWVFYANSFRHISIQYSQSTILPLPLHLAKALEEYIFNI